MNILYVVGENLTPINSGGRKVAYQRLEYLSRNNNVYLYCFYKDKDEKLVNFEFCKKCYYQRRSKYSALFRSLFMPYIIASRSGSKIKRNVKKICKENNIDLIVYEQSYVATVGLDVKNAKRVIDSHNVEYEAFKSMESTTNSKIKKFIYKYDSKRLYKFEKKIYKKYIDGMTFITKEDEKTYIDEFQLKKEKSIIIGYGVKKHNESNNSDLSNLIFVGSMNYAPNNYGGIWLASKVMPLVLKEKPNTHLYIVGKSPSEELKSYNSEKIIVTGEVDSVDEYYNKCGIVLIPIFQGGGLKVKLVEASSYNKIVISTEDGIKGSEFDQNDVIIANSEEEFANSIIKVLNGEINADSFKKNIVAKFESVYDEDNILQRYESFLLNI